uniref:Putative ovule protein n=1 Tax=Solanum chacoense TaxID=4108 RepID=A0A0V0I8Q6_SOLCH
MDWLGIYSLVGHFGKRLQEKFQMKEGRGQVESTLHLQPDSCGFKPPCYHIQIKIRNLCIQNGVVEQSEKKLTRSQED